MFELNAELLESVSGGWGRSRRSGNTSIRKTNIKSNYSKVVASNNFISKGGSLTVIVTQNIGNDTFNAFD